MNSVVQKVGDPTTALRVLIVDDDDVDAELVARSIARKGMPAVIERATTARSAIERLRSEAFDVMLLDYSMPGCNGIEMLAALRRDSSAANLAVVMMSHSADENLAVGCIEAGAQDFILKSEVSGARLQRAILHARTRYTLEQQLHTSYRQFEQLAQTDAVTGLANRYCFEKTLQLAIANNVPGRYKVGLLLIDLDNFKHVNDTFGHDVGDELLKGVVGRFKGVLRDDERLARLGGDEFALVLEHLTDPAQAECAAERLLRCLQQPITLGSLQLNASASIGIALSPDDALVKEDLFKFADVAMYSAKALGRNRATRFEASMHRQFSQRVMLEQQMREGLEDDEFEVYFQPICEPVSRRVVALEALVRWERDGEVISPAEFIPVAEETRFIHAIGGVVIKKAVRQLSELNARRAEPLRLSINLSPAQVDDEGLVDFVRRTLDEFSLPPQLVEFELTETTLLSDPDDAIRCISALSGLGCRIALDDFGTGFSSVSHLLKFPIDTVKIDRSVVPEGPYAEKSNKLLRGLVCMINTLGMDIVVEGIENDFHESLCVELKVGLVQGYYYARPDAMTKMPWLVSEIESAVALA